LFQALETDHLGGKKSAPLLEYMKNPHWDIPPLVKPKIEPPLAHRKTPLGENTSLSQNSNTIPNILEKHKKFYCHCKGKTQTTVIAVEEENRNYCSSNCNAITSAQTQMNIYFLTYSTEQSP